MSLLRDPETGHLVGIEQAPVRPAVLGDEYPKWVDVHESHVNVQKVEGEPDHVSVHGDWQHHVDRDGKVTVLAEDEDGAKAAAAEYKAADAADIQHLDEETLREVRADFKRAADAKHWDAINAALAEREKAITEETLRRMKEKQDLVNRNREEAVRLAAENRERLSVAPSTYEEAPPPSYPPPPIDPYTRVSVERTAQVDPYNLGGARQGVQTGQQVAAHKEGA